MERDALKSSWSRENPDRMKFLRQRWLDNNKEHRRQYMQEYNRKKRLASYGLTESDFDNLFESQGKKCAICETETPTKKGWCVDHCHETGDVRGVLCDHCNLMLGYAKDQVNTLQTAITYLRKNKNENV